MVYDFDEIIDRTGTDSVKYDLRKNYFGTDDLLPMWVADMDFRTPAFILRALRDRLDHEVLGYTYRGEGFSEAIRSWLKERHAWTVSREWITFSPGVVPGLSMAVQAFTAPGDKIIVQPPVYTPFFTVIKGNRRQVVYNQLILNDGRYYMDFDDLRMKAASGAKMILLSNPHNPGGMVWTRDELLQVGEICMQHGILIISDEIHNDLVYRHLNASIAVVNVMQPEGTYMSWLDFRGLQMNDKKLRDWLINTAKVGLNEGISFGPGGQGFMRLNFACPSAVLEEALIRITTAMKVTGGNNA
jgi:bifunctional pyridoxal-dependent enzyme with beta-cystathionase and maltose regulon repressor activities